MMSLRKNILKSLYRLHSGSIFPILITFVNSNNIRKILIISKK